MYSVKRNNIKHIHNMKLKTLETKIKLGVHALAELKSRVNDSIAMVDIIHQYDPAYIPPWLSGKDSLRIYKVKNVADAILAVLDYFNGEGDGTMKTNEIVSAVNKKFGTTYAPGTIRQALYNYKAASYAPEYVWTVFSSYSDDEGYCIVKVSHGVYTKLLRDELDSTFN